MVVIAALLFESCILVHFHASMQCYESVITYAMRCGGGIFDDALIVSCLQSMSVASMVKSLEASSLTCTVYVRTAVAWFFFVINLE